MIKPSYPESLPIVAEKELIIATLRAHQVVVIAGDTGSGKTTQLPKMCLEAGRGRKRLIGCTQPRRIAATSVAARVREELDAAGDIVGHKIRFKDRTTQRTRIKFMTDGILLAEAQHDRLLRAYDTIIIDEAHERSLNIDFLLGMMKHILFKREDLKLIITSATIDTAKFAASFDQAPVIEVSGRAFPVEIRYADDDEEGGETDVDYIDRAVGAVLGLRRDEGPGDMLVFMPTERDIRETVDILEKRIRTEEANLYHRSKAAPTVLPLFGRLSGPDQNRIFKRAKGQKIVVTTNVAETSITVPGIRYVVDTGLARISSYNVRARTTRLPVTRISRASCDQRAGRCGRIGPGICIRLYAEDDYLNRPQYTLPEVLRSNLAEVILRMIFLKLGDPADFPFVDPPSIRAIRDGYKLLDELGALTRKKSLSRHGHLMARLPLDPRISRMIIEARERNSLREVCVIAAALSVQDPRVRPLDQGKKADDAHQRFLDQSSDFLSFVLLWDLYEATFAKLKSQSKMRKFCKNHFLSFLRMREWRDIHEQIWSILTDVGKQAGKRRKFSIPPFVSNRTAAGSDAVHQSILAGNLRHIGLKKKGNLYQGGLQRELSIFPGSGQFNRGGQWIMAAELVETSKLYGRCVAPIQVDWLEPLAGDLCHSSYSSPHWEKKRGQVVAYEKVTLFGLCIVAGRKVNYGRIDPDEARTIFIQTALVQGELGGRHYGFFDHNRKLVRDLEAMEDRVRRRDILVDDYALFSFYDERLGRIRDRASLAHLIKKKRGDDFLRMTREDIINQPPDSEQLDDFPETIRDRELIFSLSYSFSPGSEDDGVTALIPMDLLEHVRPEIFEWLVPGLLHEKVVFLLKGLPKSIRKQLIPVSRTAEELLADLTPYSGSLCSRLAKIIYDSFRLRVEPRHWPSRLPDHLRMRFFLQNGKKTVAVSRSLAEFSGMRPTAEPGKGLSLLKKKWERGGITTWDFTGLSERIAIKGKQGELTGYAYPGLVAEEGGSVAIHLFRDGDKRCRETRKGLLALYGFCFSRHLKQLKKDFFIPRSHWALYEGLAGHEEMNDDLYYFILLEIFGCRPGLIPDEEEFKATIARLKKTGLHVEGKELFEQVILVLRERRNVLDFIGTIESRLRKKGKSVFSEEDCRNFRGQVEALIGHGFLRQVTRARLAHLPRYLKAIQIRIERRLADPAKDTLKSARIQPFVKRLDLEGVASRKTTELMGMTVEQRHHLEEYREMLDEFRVSIFAPELKTAFPVSEKRLEKKWREMEEGGWPRV
ncbi:MAG: ATP-dependent RNA helicase HrpA [Thermodesulfobacteriota bacterium]|nr:ATP-dependent RNA helicase HrpA [Thermodesulfobacteriota bacterium]